MQARLRQERALKEQREIALRVAKEENLVYDAFPHPQSPLCDDIKPWVEQGAYFMLKRDQQRVFLHRNCEGSVSQTLKPQVHKFAETHPVVVLDLSVYPVLLNEYEWPFYITSADPAYRTCTCSYARYILEDQAVHRQYYRLAAPYFYLCHLNVPGQDGFRQTLLADQVKQ